MRPRIRTLKPELWHDESVGRLSRDARLLFITLVTMADDEGRLRASAALIVGHGFPYDIDATRRLPRWLAEIVAAGMVVEYEAGDLPYLAFRHWKRHQRITRGTPSDLPPPPDAEVVEANAVDENPRTRTAKAAIPERVRREVAKRHGAMPGETVDAGCSYCEAPGTIHWPRLSGGKPGSWVSFSGLELDVHPESEGGEPTADNIVLTCKRCNASKGHGTVTDFRDRLARQTATTGHGST